MSTLTRLRPTLRTTGLRINSNYLAGLRTKSITAKRNASTHSLVFLEHSNGQVEPASLSALAAAIQLGSNKGKVTGIVVGSKDEVEKVLPNVKK